MVKNLVLQQHIRAHLALTKISYQTLAKKIGVSPSTLFSWGEGSPITLSDRNIRSLQILAEEVDIDLPFLLFSLDTAERFHATQKLDLVIAPHLKTLWSEFSKEIRLMVRNEIQAKK